MPANIPQIEIVVARVDPSVVEPVHLPPLFAGILSAAQMGKRVNYNFIKNDILSSYNF